MNNEHDCTTIMMHFQQQKSLSHDINPCDIASSKKNDGKPFSVASGLPTTNLINVDCTSSCSASSVAWNYTTPTIDACHTWWHFTGLWTAFTCRLPTVCLATPYTCCSHWWWLNPNIKPMEGQDLPNAQKATKKIQQETKRVQQEYFYEQFDIFLEKQFNKLSAFVEQHDMKVEYLQKLISISSHYKQKWQLTWRMPNSMWNHWRWMKAVLRATAPSFQSCISSWRRTQHSRTFLRRLRRCWRMIYLRCEI